MMGRARTHARSQGGYTLIEVIITLAISAVVMTGLTSVVLTAMQANRTASARAEASAQIRNFQSFAYDDMVAGGVPGTPGCGTTPAAACTTQALTLVGVHASGGAVPTTSPYQVTYVWDGSNFVDRQVASTGSSTHVSTSVSSFSWYLNAVGGKETVVVNMTVTVGSFSQSQTFLFYPRAQ